MKSKILVIGGAGFIGINATRFFLKKNKKLNLRFKFDKERQGDQKIFISNNSKLFKMIKWKPKIFYKEGLNKIFKWKVNNLDIIKSNIR